MNKMHYDNKTVPQNVKYTVIPARSNKPLTDAERGLELFELDKIFKRQTYDEQKKWMLENTNLFLDGADNEFAPHESANDLA